MNTILSDLSKYIEKTPKNLQNANPLADNKKEVKEEKEEITSINDAVSLISGERREIRNEVVQKLSDLLSKKTSDYGDPSPILDLLMELSGANRVGLPGSELAAVTRIITKLWRYLSLRVASGEKPNFEGIEDTAFDLIGESACLYSYVMSNLSNSNEEDKVK